MARVLDEYTKEYAHQLAKFRRQWTLQQEREEELNRVRQEGVDQGFSQGISQRVFQGKIEEAKESFI